METDDEKISARIKMIDETEVTQSAQAWHGLARQMHAANAWVSSSEFAIRGNMISMANMVQYNAM